MEKEPIEPDFSDSTGQTNFTDDDLTAPEFSDSTGQVNFTDSEEVEEEKES